MYYHMQHDFCTPQKLTSYHQEKDKRETKVDATNDTSEIMGWD